MSEEISTHCFHGEHSGYRTRWEDNVQESGQGGCEDGEVEGVSGSSVLTMLNPPLLLPGTYVITRYNIIR
jgi:hypothetical protein